MFSRKTVLICGVLVCFAVNVVFLSLSIKHRFTTPDTKGFVLTATGPFQKLMNLCAQSVLDVWYCYFSLADAAAENTRLRQALSHALERNNQCEELNQANQRLRKLLSFQESLDTQSVAAAVIGKDPSPWFKSIVIDKGEADGVQAAMPVMVSEGVVGVVTSAAEHYARVLLIIDQNSSVDAIVQKTRARGIIKGRSSGICGFEYVLRRHRIDVGDVVISSGLDGVFPKGLRIGYVSEVVPTSGGIFQAVEVTPFVDFEKLEEVIVLLDRAERAAATGSSRLP